MLPEPQLSDMKIHLGDKLKTEGAEKPARSLCLIHALQLHSLHAGLFFHIQTEDMFHESPNNNLLQVTVCN